MSASGLERLEQEMRNQAARLESYVRNRTDHPSYGVTLAMVRSSLDVLTGMAEAWLFASGTWPHCGAILWDSEARELVRVGTGVNLERAINLEAQLRKRP